MRWLGPEQLTYTAGRGLTDVLVKHNLKSNSTEVLTEEDLERSEFLDVWRHRNLSQDEHRTPAGDLRSRRERRTPGNSPPSRSG